MLRKTIACLFAQPMDPLGERLLHGLEKPLDSGVAQFAVSVSGESLA